MIDFVRPAHPFEGQTQRLAAEAINGGGDVFEIARTSRNIDIGDTDAWQREWHALAVQVEAEARAELAAGHSQTAMGRFFSANQYYRQSDVFLTGTPEGVGPLHDGDEVAAGISGLPDLSFWVSRS